MCSELTFLKTLNFRDLFDTLTQRFDILSAKHMIIGTVENNDLGWGGGNKSPSCPQASVEWPVHSMEFKTKILLINMVTCINDIFVLVV